MALSVLSNGKGVMSRTAVWIILLLWGCRVAFRLRGLDFVKLESTVSRCMHTHCTAHVKGEQAEHSPKPLPGLTQVASACVRTESRNSFNSQLHTRCVPQ